MLWVVQGNLSYENNFKNLIEILNNHRLDYVLVKPVPYTLSLTTHDYDSFSNLPMPEPLIDESRNIMVIGSYTLSKIAKSRQWRPGAFMENLNFNAWKNGWGATHLLNAHAQIGSLENIRVPLGWTKFFARPLEDTKSFSGTVFEADNFQHWREQIIKINEPLSVNRKTPIILAPLQVIHQECRFFVINKKVVTGSMYKLKEHVIYAPCHDQEMIDFAQEMVDKWTPNEAFCLDVARTENGFKIIEVNGINSAGFYACDLEKIVLEIEKMEILL